MNNLMNKQTTMSSREIAELTGKQHQHVKRDIEIMLTNLGEDVSKFGHIYTDAVNREQTEYLLDRFHTEVLVTGYDVKRRAAVIKRWYDLETNTLKDPQLAAMVTMLTQLDAVKQEQIDQRLELDTIKAKITATPEEYFTVAGYASLRGINIDTKKANFLGREASKMSRKYGFDIGKAHSTIYGQVNSYHVDVLCELFSKLTKR